MISDAGAFPALEGLCARAYALALLLSKDGTTNDGTVSSSGTEHISHTIPKSYGYPFANGCSFH